MLSLLTVYTNGYLLFTKQYLLLKIKDNLHMIHLRRKFCTAVLQQSIPAKAEGYQKHPLKFISQLPSSDLKSEAHLERLEHSIHHRKSTFPIKALKQQFELLQELNQKWTVLENKKKEVNKQYHTADTDQMKEKLKHNGITIREDIRQLREVITSLKEEINKLTQTMPNVLHERIPLEQPYLISEWQPKELRNNLPKDSSRLNFPSSPYNTDKRAWFDLMIPIKILQLMKAKGFIHSSNPDFLRRFVARAGGVNDENYNTLHEENETGFDSSLYLVGGGSFASYLSYFTRFSTYPTALPLKLVTIGKQYDSSHVSDKAVIPSQGQVVQFFIATKTAEETNMALDEVINLYEDIYKKFGCAFKMSLAPAHLLKNPECLRVDLSQQSTTVADINYYGDYISKRILFNYRVGKQYALPYILIGTVVHIPKLLQNIDLDTFDLNNFN